MATTKEKASDGFKQVILSYLEKRAATDPLFAKTFQKEGKSIELSLKNMEIVQCRGLRNQNTKYQDDIMDLIRQNLKAIRRAASARQVA